jgi:hypothetical protein
MAQHDNRRSRRRVIAGGEDAAPECADTERREVVACDVLGAQRPGRRLDVLPPHAHTRATRLKCREFFELRQLRLQALEQREREHPPAILRTALYAARRAVADAIKARRIADRQRAQHHRVQQRENGCRAADAERERQDSGNREDPRDPELSRRVAKFAEEGTHLGLRREKTSKR